MVGIGTPELGCKGVKSWNLHSGNQTVHGRVVKLIFIAIEEVAIRHYIRYKAIQNNPLVRVTRYSY